LSLLFVVLSEPRLTVRTAGSLFFDAPRRPAHPSASDSRGRNTDALAFLASAHLAFRAKGKPCRIAPARLVPCPVFLILTISQGQGVLQWLLVAYFGNGVQRPVVE